MDLIKNLLPLGMGSIKTTVGIIGGGQLAAMMAIAAQDLGIAVAIQTSNSDDPATAWADRVVLADVTDAIATQELASSVDVVTFENEFMDLKKLQALRVKFIPSLDTLAPLLDKYTQRQYLQAHGLPVPQFMAIADPADLSNLDFPLVLKARRNGYDGQGTKIVNNLAELQSAWQAMGAVPSLVEAKINFTSELAVIAARAEDGQCLVYPVVETHQIQQVCRHVVAPARLDPSIMTKVRHLSEQILKCLDGVGVFGIEYFLTPEQQIYVNEIAPRTHNSGHYTIEACATSQFAQLLRIASGMPLGSIAMRSPVAVMVNLLGYENIESDYTTARQQLAAALPYGSVHWYGKNISRVGRKLGHVTVLLEDYTNVEQTLATINSIWYNQPKISVKN